MRRAERNGSASAARGKEVTTQGRSPYSSFARLILRESVCVRANLSEVKLLKRKFPALLLCLSIASLTEVFGQMKQPVIYDDATAYEVYAAILSSHPIPPGGRLILRHETITNFGTFTNDEGAESTCLKPEREYDKLIGGAIRDFVKVTKTKWRLREKFIPKIPYALITSDEIASLNSEGGWERFYKKHPASDGFVDLSAVGFNSDKTIAVVSKGRWCGILCGEGAYHVLVKKDGKWVPLEWKGIKCHWISE